MIALIFAFTSPVWAGFGAGSNHSGPGDTNGHTGPAAQSHSNKEGGKERKEGGNLSNSQGPGYNEGPPTPPRQPNAASGKSAEEDQRRFNREQQQYERDRADYEQRQKAERDRARREEAKKSNQKRPAKVENITKGKRQDSLNFSGEQNAKHGPEAKTSKGRQNKDKPGAVAGKGSPTAGKRNKAAN